MCIRDRYTAKHGLAVPYPGIVMRTGMSGGTIRLIQQKLNTLGEKIGTDCLLYTSFIALHPPLACNKASVWIFL